MVLTTGQGFLGKLLRGGEARIIFWICIACVSAHFYWYPQPHSFIPPVLCKESTNLFVWHTSSTQQLLVALKNRPKQRQRRRIKRWASSPKDNVCSLPTAPLLCDSWILYYISHKSRRNTSFLLFSPLYWETLGGGGGSGSFLCFPNI